MLQFRRNRLERSTMFKLSNVGFHQSAEAQKLDDAQLMPWEANKRLWPSLVDIIIIVVMSLLLYWGAWVRYAAAGLPEPAKYRCYALAFWKGTANLGDIPRTDCWFLSLSSSASLINHLQAGGFPSIFIKLIELQSPAKPFHALPHEYPLLSIIPFTLTMLAPSHWYLLVFAIWMSLIAGGVYFMLKRFKSSGAAIAFVVYLVVGSWVTALARFDLVPAALTLGAVMLAERARWKWAFVLLALATLLKFYALVLILPLFIAQQKQCSGARWFSWRRWDGFARFIAVCVVVTTISLLLNVDGTLGSLAYFKDRPIQVEAFQAGLLWLGSFLGYSLQFVYSFGSGNVLSELSSPVSLGATLCFVAGLCYTYWLQWRGRLDVATASLVALLVATVTAKVFSPQYLIWVTPFVAYMGKSNWKWLASWGGVAVLTSFIYPYIYTLASATPGVISVGQIPAFYPAVLLRGAIMLGIIFALLYQAVRIKASRQSSLVSPS